MGDAESLERLINEQPEEFASRFPENRRLPATGAERYGEQGFPTLVVSLIREWAAELRQVGEHYKEQHGLDLIAIVRAVKRREQSLKNLPSLLRIWHQHSGY